MRRIRVLVAVALVFELSALVAGALASQPVDGGETADLEVVLSGLESPRGQVRIAVFDSPETWLGTAAFAEVVEVEGRSVEWTFRDVPTGAYGIVVFHDVNSNGKNDRNFIGIPKEPYGFSNNVRIGLGPPKWKKASFPVVAPRTTIEIEVK